MQRHETLVLLRKHLPRLTQEFGVRSLAIFGSIARDEAGPQGDVDVLVEFDASPTFDQYMGLKLYLEDLLGVRVDLATPRALKERVRPYVEREAIRVT